VPGATTVTGECGAGYYCTTKATTTTPDITVADVQGLCDLNQYCEKGSVTPTDCSAGTFNNVYGSRTADSCLDCSEGFYCDGTNPRTKCSGGYICAALTDVDPSTDSSLETTPGHFTGDGFPAEVDCEPGTYQDGTNSASCEQCELTKMCPDFGMDAGTICADGADCSALGTITPKFCEYGYY